MGIRVAYSPTSNLRNAPFAYCVKCTSPGQFKKNMAETRTGRNYDGSPLPISRSEMLPSSHYSCDGVGGLWNFPSFLASRRYTKYRSSHKGYSATLVFVLRSRSTPDSGKCVVNEETNQEKMAPRWHLRWQHASPDVIQALSERESLKERSRYSEYRRSCGNSFATKTILWIIFR